MNRFQTNSYFRNASQEISITRRKFLWDVARTTAGTSLFSFAPILSRSPIGADKTVVVTFGGGARDEETFAVEGQRYIPRLLGELIPQATFFTQVVNKGILGYYVANASLATGCYESFDNFIPVAPRNPTLFEYYLRDIGRPASDVWVIASSNGFQHIGASEHNSYGERFGATMVLPKQLLASLRGTTAVSLDHLLRDNYESAAKRRYQASR